MTLKASLAVYGVFRIIGWKAKSSSTQRVRQKENPTTLPLSVKSGLLGLVFVAEHDR